MKLILSSQASIALEADKSALEEIKLGKHSKHGATYGGSCEVNTAWFIQHNMSPTQTFTLEIIEGGKKHNYVGILPEKISEDTYLLTFSKTNLARIEDISGA